ncbi:MAG: glycoside hydrolase family 57 protein [Candidatus Bathyarchaeota archaeon]|nr:MAG: glycoside hydrolase family 57 protein [Candidatus Bathyarchaeota archaeon]
MTDICLMFEVHQPFRLNRKFHSDLLALGKVTKKDLFNLYFDHELNRHVFVRAAEKCYFPANSIILEQIDRYKREQKKFKVAYGISGVFIEQCERWSPDLLESFKQLSESGCVEFLDEPYYHSLASLHGTDRSEFVEQIEIHRQLMKDLFNYEPQVVENTECLYNNAIAKTMEGMGYKATVTEGAERILRWRSPNYVYKAKDSNLRVLLRNYGLSDDIGFRFSSTLWEEWPLNASKYASWLAAASGQVVVLFVDYETFGEHHWPESGIHEFLEWLPGEVNKWDHLWWRTPSEVACRHAPIGEIDVHEYNTISWADLERDPSAWINNPMQTVCYESLKELEKSVKGTGDEDLIRLWRYLQMSDNLYYMSIKGGGPGDVHSYFNPMGSPVEAFAVYSRILSDLEARILVELEKPELTAKRMLRRLPIGKGFTFFYEFARPSGLTVHSLEEFYAALKTVDTSSIRFHIEKGDFERWLRQVVGDIKLSNELTSISKKRLRGKALRKRLLATMERRIKELKGITEGTSVRTKHRRRLKTT